MLERTGSTRTNNTQSFVNELFRRLVGMEKRDSELGFKTFDFRTLANAFKDDPVYQYIPIINRTSTRAVYRTQGWFMHSRE